MFFEKNEFLSSEQKEILVKAIASAELNTSGEIRVHLEKSCGNISPLERAYNIFTKQKMYATDARNAVLIYIAHEDKKFAIYGDLGIHEIVGDEYWNQTKTMLAGYFAKKEFTEGVSAAIADVGEKLKTHFPYYKNDKNELPNEISEG